MDEDLKARLLKPRIAEADVEIPGLGTVRVRGLTRVEAIMVQKMDGPEAYDRMTISLGMVNPPMTQAEAGQWQRSSPAGEIDPVTDKIAELSGMTKRAGKEVYKEFEDDPGAEFRVLPRPEVEHDGSDAAGNG